MKEAADGDESKLEVAAANLSRPGRPAGRPDFQTQTWNFTVLLASIFV
jgi:hypothetical protein